MFTFIERRFNSVCITDTTVNGQQVSMYIMIYIFYVKEGLRQIQTTYTNNANINSTTYCCYYVAITDVT